MPLEKNNLLKSHSLRVKRRGQTLIEFAACAVLSVCLLIAVIEFGRMVLAYTTVNNAARIGVRYAMVNGFENSGSSSATALATLTTNVQTVVANYLSAAAIDSSSATVNVSYPGVSGCTSVNNPGCPVKVSVSYPYQTMFSYFPIHVTLASQAEGVFTF